MFFHPEIKVFFLRKSLRQKHAKPNEFNENQKNLYVFNQASAIVYRFYQKMLLFRTRNKGFFSQKIAESKACEAQQI